MSEVTQKDKDGFDMFIKGVSKHFFIHGLFVGLILGFAISLIIIRVTA
jgi:hypothetical protein